MRLRCWLLRRLTAPCGPALGLLRLLRGLLLTEAALGCGLLLRLRLRCALPRLARFVAVNVEDLFNFGITLLRGFFALLQADFDNKRDVMKLARILHVENADNMANCGKLAMRDFCRLRVGMVQVQAISAGRAHLRAVNKLDVKLQITAVVRLVRLHFRRFDNAGMTTDRQASAALRWVELLCVERLKKLCHVSSPFRKVPTVKAVEFAYLSS